MTLIAWLRAPLLGLALASAVGCGSDIPDDCNAVCSKNVECQKDTEGQESCVALCKKLAEDDDYADALGAQADCYAGKTCEAIAQGGCDDP